MFHVLNVGEHEAGISNFIRHSLSW
jgi:hypothetical protein